MCVERCCSWLRSPSGASTCGGCKERRAPLLGSVPGLEILTPTGEQRWWGSAVPPQAQPPLVEGSRSSTKCPGSCAGCRSHGWCGGTATLSARPGCWGHSPGEIPSCREWKHFYSPASEASGGESSFPYFLAIKCPPAPWLCLRNGISRVASQLGAAPRGQADVAGRCLLRNCVLDSLACAKMLMAGGSRCPLPTGTRLGWAAAR